MFQLKIISLSNINILCNLCYAYAIIWIFLLISISDYPNFIQHSGKFYDFAIQTFPFDFLCILFNFLFFWSCKF